MHSIVYPDAEKRGVFAALAVTNYAWCIQLCSPILNSLMCFQRLQSQAMLGG